MQSDLTQLIQQQVNDAYHRASPLVITSNGNKKFYGHQCEGTPLVVSQHSGVISYEPTELVITARAGTPLTEIESLLEENSQQLAFEPPHFQVEKKNSAEQTITTLDGATFGSATLGGTIACGLSGPARANNGAIRDFVLGCEVINGKGEQLKFGGQVMKNVAGYDASRLICGSFGTLGVILNVSLKVLPRPELQRNLSFSVSREQAYEKLAQWNNQPYPITASCYYDGQLSLRLSGNEQAVKTTVKKLGGDSLNNNDDFWQSIKEQQHPFFISDQPLWRISAAPFAKLNIDVKQSNWLSEWHGALHWLKTNMPATELRQQIEEIAGHATLFRNASSQDAIFHPLTESLFTLSKNIKKAFDPKDILNRNKMYRFN